MLLAVGPKGCLLEEDQTSNPTDSPLEMKGTSVVVPFFWKLKLGRRARGIACPNLLEYKPSVSCYSLPSSKAHHGSHCLQELRTGEADGTLFFFLIETT